MLGERSSRTEAESGHPTSVKVTYGAIWAGKLSKNNTYANGASNGDERATGYAVFGAVFSENALDWGVNGRRSDQCVVSSDHPAGGNAVFCDGSVHFLSDNLSILTLRGLASIKDGLVVNNY